MNHSSPSPSLRCAVIDIGSNTIKMTTYDYGGGQLAERKRKTVNAGLIAYVQGGRLTDEGIRILTSAVKELYAFAKADRCTKIYPFATAGLRAASNSSNAIDAVFDATGLVIDLISGDREAKLSFEAILPSLDRQVQSGIAIDMGGGSTELVGFASRKAKQNVSLRLGALVLYNKFVTNILPTPREAKLIRTYVLSKLAKHAWLADYGSTIYINGGTGRTLARLHAGLYGHESDLPYRISYTDMKSMLELITSMDRSFKQLILKEVPTRVHTFPAGLCALLAIMERAGATDLVVTTASIREGYLLSRLNK